MFRFALVAIGIFAYQLYYGEKSTRKGLMRIWMNLDMFLARTLLQLGGCLEIFQETRGLGIGAGGYARVIVDYDWRIYD